jgi:hypothetical protein
VNVSTAPRRSTAGERMPTLILVPPFTLFSKELAMRPEGVVGGARGAGDAGGGRYAYARWRLCWLAVAVASTASTAAWR